MTSWIKIYPIPGNPYIIRVVITGHAVKSLLGMNGEQAGIGIRVTGEYGPVVPSIIIWCMNYTLLINRILILRPGMIYRTIWIGRGNAKLKNKHIT